MFNEANQNLASIKPCEVEIGRKVRSGNPRNLSSFIQWACLQYPAEHYFLILWGHGAGVADDDAACWLVQRYPLGPRPKRGGCKDQKAVSARKCLLTNPATLKNVLEEALPNIGCKLDIIGLDSCQMNMAEIGCQFRGYANLLLASQTNVPRRSWPYLPFLKLLASNPNISPRDFAYQAATTYVTNYRDYPDQQVMLSVLDLQLSTQVIQCFFNLVSVLRRFSTEPAIKTAIRSARRRAKGFAKNLFVDLIDFCQLLANTCDHPRLVESANAMLAVTRAFVICNQVLSDDEHCYGVSLYFPFGNRGILYHRQRLARSYKRLEFAKRTGWGGFLSNFLELEVNRDKA